MLSQDQQIGKYKILSPLGAGGMGEVFLAEDTRLDRKVALKILPADFALDGERMRRFVREAKATSALNHPNIITIHEISDEPDTHFMATEYIEGETLRARLKRNPFSVDEALEIGIQVVSALQAAHSVNIVHRDIKPENIMIRPDGLVKVLDFGLAKLTEKKPDLLDAEAATAIQAQTVFGMIVGTAPYMSPEQAQGKKIDIRSDIFSFGIVLYEMLTRKQPFAGESAIDVIGKILHKEPIPLKQLLPGIPDELERIIKKALCKDCEERYQTAKDLNLDLKSLKHRLEFEAELERSHPPSQAPKSATDNHFESHNEAANTPEAATRMMPAPVTRTLAPAADPVQNSPQTFKSPNRRPPLLQPIFILVFLLAGAISWIFIWKSKAPEPNTQPTAATNLPVSSDPVLALKPSRLLTYSLTVQSYSDGRYKTPFKLSGEMLFRNKDRVRLNIKSPQAGYLYILNESPQGENGEPSFNILFPSPTANGGSARLSENQEIQIPEQSWFELDGKEGTELVWLIWSENALAELESAKRFANPENRGRIKDPALIKFIESLLQNHPLNKGDVQRDDDKKESKITTNYGTLAHVIKLEHH